MSGKMSEVSKGLRAKGYHPFGWGDFWNTGCNARAAMRRQKGFQASSSQSDPIIWDTTTGPRGGCWIRYRRQSKAQ